jgi:hypothetical protein
MKILDNAAKKIKEFNSNPKDRPRKSYHCVLDARAGKRSFVDKNGSVSHKYLEMIDWALRSYFAMDRGNSYRGGTSMGNRKQFVNKLGNKLGSHEARKLLAALRDVSIISSSLEVHRLHAEELYKSLSNPEDGLSANKTRFCVGTTKVMHCLLPEFFVLLDSNVGKNVLNYSGGQYNNFVSYWKVMEICRDELLEWQKLYGSIDSLLNLDSEPTSLTRIFDKCAFFTKP